MYSSAGISTDTYPDPVFVQSISPNSSDRKTKNDHPQKAPAKFCINSFTCMSSLKWKITAKKNW